MQEGNAVSAPTRGPGWNESNWDGPDWDGPEWDGPRPTDAGHDRPTGVWARVRPIVLRTIIGAVVAAGLVGVVAVLVGDFGTVAVQLLLTILVVVVFALLSWYDADVSSKRSSVFALASVATSLYLLVAGFCKVWIVPTYVLDPYSSGPTVVTSGWTIGEQFWQWIGLVLIARAALLHVHLLLIIHRRYPTPVLQVVAKVTVGLIALLAVLVSIPVLFSHTHLGEGFWRVLWVVAILDLLGTVIVPLSNALFRPRVPYPGGMMLGGWAPEGAMPNAPMPNVPMPLPNNPVPNAPAPASATAWGSVPPVTAPAPGTSATAHGPAAAAPEPSATTTSGPGTTAQEPPTRYRYEPAPTGRRALAWPRYVDGTPLPAAPDGTPDFREVERF